MHFRVYELILKRWDRYLSLHWNYGEDPKANQFGSSYSEVEVFASVVISINRSLKW